MGIVRLFSSFSGRIGRVGFWLGMATLFVAASLGTASVAPDLLSDNPFRALVDNWEKMGPKAVAIYLALLFPAMALVVKRLHDRNKSGLIAALFWAPALIQSAVFLIPGVAAVSDWLTWGVGWLTAWIGGIGTWFFIELGFYGPKEPNKYDNDPRTH